MSPAAVPPSSTATWGWSDLVVAVGVFLAVASLIFPAIQRSRMNARLVGCQNNLRDLGLSQAQFQQAHADLSGAVGPGGRLMPAGVPFESLLRQGALPDFTPARPAQSARLPWRTTPMTPAGAGRVPWSAHPGFSQAVRGQNLLFLDGHVTFLAAGPAVDPALDDPQPVDSVAPVWPARRSDAAASSPIAPIVLESRPGP